MIAFRVKRPTGHTSWFVHAPAGALFDAFPNRQKMMKMLNPKRSPDIKIDTVSVAPDEYTVLRDFMNDTDNQNMYRRPGEKIVADSRLLTAAEAHRWAVLAHRHGHGVDYYNDSECQGCAVFRAEDPKLAARVLDVINYHAQETSPAQEGG